MPAALCVTLPVAFRMSDEPAVPVVIAALIAMLLFAVSVSELPDDQVTAFATVIVPALAAGEAVVTSTLFRAKAFCKVVVFNIEVAVVASWNIVEPEVSIVFVPVEMVIFVGSSSNLPARPLAAVVSTSPLKSK